MVSGRGFRGIKEEVSGKFSGGDFRRRFLGSIQWEFLGETLSGGFKIFQGIVQGKISVKVYRLSF